MLLRWLLMLWSQCRIQTFREPSHPLLVRAGFDEGTLLRARAEERIGRELGPDTLAVPDPAGQDTAPEAFHTPGCKTIAELAAFTALPESSLLKSIVMLDNGKPLLLLLRGDHALHEKKLRRITGAGHPRAAKPEEIRHWFGADPGSLGPVNAPPGIRIIADLPLHGRRHMISGANRDDYHLRHVTPAVSFGCEFHPLSLSRAEATFLQAAETQHDKDGFAWRHPWLAPFDAVITPVFWADQDQRDAAAQLHDELTALGLEPLLDDRDERPGVKFKDADLIGIPFRITLGRKLAGGLLEIADRRTRVVTDVPRGDAAAFIHGKIGNGA